MLFSRKSKAVVLALGSIVALFLIAPSFVSIPVAFTDSRQISMPQEHWSIQHFQALFANTQWLSSFGQSFLLAIVTAGVTAVLGTAFAIGVWRATGRWVLLVSAIISAPMILPPIVSGLALYRAWVSLGLYDTFFGVAIAHAILALPYVVLTVSAGLTQLDHRIEWASRSLGAGRIRTVVSVVAPNISGSIITGALFAFILSWDEIVVTLFVANRAVYTLPRKMWDGIRENFDPTVAAVATILIAVTLAILAVAAFTSLVRKPQDRSPS